MGAKTKIDWADAAWNPVTGCNHGCEYCYARRMAERFSTQNKYKRTYEPVLDVRVRRVRKEPEPYPYGFQPTFHCYRLDIPKHWKKPRNIFVCSMADLFGDWVPDEWIKAVFEACVAAPQHRYLFLTKNPGRYSKKKLVSITRVRFASIGTSEDVNLRLILLNPIGDATGILTASSGAGRARRT